MSDQDKPLGYVEIKRRRGRIAGFAKPSYPVELLVCGTNRPRKKFGQRANGWSFPPAVRELLLQQTQGKTVLHLFGGLADFGYRLDVDELVRPDVLGSAWEAEKFFTRDSFDDVVLDPPYMQFRANEIEALLYRAAWIGRRFVWWLGTCSIGRLAALTVDHKWLVDCGPRCAVRVLQKFSIHEPKLEPRESDLQRGEGLKLKHTRWRESRVVAPLFPDLPTSRAANHSDLPIVTPKHLPSGEQNRNKVYLGDLI